MSENKTPLTGSIIAFFILLFSINCIAQDSVLIYRVRYFPPGIYDTVSNGNQYKKDTISVLMLVADTTTGHIIFWVKGWEIRNGVYKCCDPSDNMMAMYFWSYSHVLFLDEKLNPLSKNIIVWQLQQL
jgi:hypothetical protein